jgi:hypothetical protein
MYHSYSPYLINGHYVSFEFSWVNSGYGISNVSSGLVGFTLGVSWSHLNSSSFTSINGVIHYTIYGIQHYNIIVEGIGTLFSQATTITGYYQPCTGAGRITGVSSITGM